VSVQPKASRMERQVRNQARGLFWVSVLLLISCATMTGLFGWSQGRTLIEKAVFLIGLVGADLGGAYLMSTSGTCSANKERGAAAGAAVFAMLCMVLTFTGIIGFQSENRESQAQARERAAKVAESFVDWAKNTTGEAMALEKVKEAKSKEKPTGVASAFALGVENVGKAVEKQISMLQSGELAAVGDGQATTIARITGLREADARSWAISGTSAALLVIQYACLWYYGFLRHRIEPAVTSLNHGPRASENGRHFPDSVRKVAKPEAKLDIQQLVAANIELCNEELAARWGVSESEASKWQSEFAREGLMRRVQRGRRKVAVAPLRQINGNGAHLSSA